MTRKVVCKICTVYYQVVMNDAPVVPLWYDEVVHLVQPYVSGFKPNALNLLELRRTKLVRK